MIEWFESLTAIERFFAYVAIPSTLVLVIQTVLLILGLAGGGGGGADEGFDFDSDGETDFELDPDPDIPHDGDFSDVPDGGLRLFTVRENNTTCLVPDNNQRRERHITATFNRFGNTVDRNQFVYQIIRL